MAYCMFVRPKKNKKLEIHLGKTAIFISIALNRIETQRIKSNQVQIAYFYNGPR